MPDFQIERNHPPPVVGIDEAGRGPWAGPVVAAAIILDATRMPSILATDLDDSKRLSRGRREKLFAELKRLELEGSAMIRIGQASVAEIDSTNILIATMKAMERAVEVLPHTPAFAIVDGKQLPPNLPCPGRAYIGGDGLSLSIAAASIIAKVRRDRIMGGLAANYPGYGWEHNAGYGTAEHKAALDRLGPTPHHRSSFMPIRKLMEFWRPPL